MAVVQHGVVENPGKQEKIIITPSIGFQTTAESKSVAFELFLWLKTSVRSV